MYQEGKEANLEFPIWEGDPKIEVLVKLQKISFAS